MGLFKAPRDEHGNVLPASDEMIANLRSSKLCVDRETPQTLSASVLAAVLARLDLVELRARNEQNPESGSMSP